MKREELKNLIQNTPIGLFKYKTIFSVEELQQALKQEYDSSLQQSLTKQQIRSLKRLGRSDFEDLAFIAAKVSKLATKAFKQEIEKETQHLKEVPLQKLFSSISGGRDASYDLPPKARFLKGIIEESLKKVRRITILYIDEGVKKHRQENNLPTNVSSADLILSAKGAENTKGLYIKDLYDEITKSDHEKTTNIINEVKGYFTAIFDKSRLHIKERAPYVFDFVRKIIEHKFRTARIDAIKEIYLKDSAENSLLPNIEKGEANRLFETSFYKNAKELDARETVRTGKDYGFSKNEELKNRFFSIAQTGAMTEREVQDAVLELYCKNSTFANLDIEYAKGYKKINYVTGRMEKSPPKFFPDFAEFELINKRAIKAEYQNKQKLENNNQNNQKSEHHIQNKVEERTKNDNVARGSVAQGSVTQVEERVGESKEFAGSKQVTQPTTTQSALNENLSVGLDKKLIESSNENSNENRKLSVAEQIRLLKESLRENMKENADKSKGLNGLGANAEARRVADKNQTSNKSNDKNAEKAQDADFEKSLDKLRKTVEIVSKIKESQLGLTQTGGQKTLLKRKS